MTNPVQQTQALGQSIWYDHIRRGLLSSGELTRLIEQGVTGVTSKPTIFEKAIAGSNDYDEALVSLASADKTTDQIYEALVLADIRAAADLLRPTYDQSAAADGYASLEVSHNLAHDTEGTVAEGKRLFAALDRPNVMIKVPATPEGIPAVRRLIGEGINVNVTLIFSLDAHDKVMDAYVSGLEDLANRGGDLSRVASVASFFVSRVDTAVDALLDKDANAGQAGPGALPGKAAIANAKIAYQAFKAVFDSPRFAARREKGARAQRPLWASTGTKNPAFSDVLYVESLIGSDTVNTVPPATLTAFLEHGVAQATLEHDVSETDVTFAALSAAGIRLDEITATLLKDGVSSFADSFSKLMSNIEEKIARLNVQDHLHPDVSLGDALQDVETSLAGLDEREVIGRIWRKDHTVWKSDPTEISDRLGWLTVTEQICEQAPALEAFAQEVREAGYRHVVLLGMGVHTLVALQSDIPQVRRDDRVLQAAQGMVQGQRLMAKNVQTRAGDGLRLQRLHQRALIHDRPA
jgi:transaldolase/glucose-6-phosphate isomerase